VMSLLNISEKENFLSSSPRPNPLSNLKKCYIELKANPIFHMNFASSMYSHFMIQVTGSIADSAELKASPSKDAAAVYGPMLER